VHFDGAGSGIHFPFLVAYEGGAHLEYIAQGFPEYFGSSRFGVRAAQK
jgi:hypothetical protein